MKVCRIIYSFDVLLTVRLSIFSLAINQLDAQNFCFTISLFHTSTCFEHHVLIIRRSQLYYTASGIITPIGGRLVHRLREELIIKQNFCASSWLITKLNYVQLYCFKNVRSKLIEMAS